MKITPLVTTRTHALPYGGLFRPRRADGVITGDLMDSPLQARYPELSIVFDVDPAQAAETRREFLERYCDTNTLCCPAHFPSPSGATSSAGVTGSDANQSERNEEGGAPSALWSLKPGQTMTTQC